MKIYSVILIACLCALAGCGTPASEVPIASTLPTERTEPLTIPTGIEQDKVIDMYRPQSEQEIDFHSQLYVPLPRQLISAREEISVRLRKLGDLAWIATELEPSSVWPLLVTYWRTSAGGLRSADHVTGTIRTGEYEATDGSLMRAVIRLDGGFRAGTSEVQISEYKKQGNNWVLMQTDTSPASQLVALTRYITQVTQESTPSSLIARALNDRHKATLDNSDEDNQKLVLSTSMERAWATVLAALAEIEVPVLERDLSRRTLVVGTAGSQTDIDDQPEQTEQTEQTEETLAPASATLFFEQKDKRIYISKGEFTDPETQAGMTTLFADIIAIL